MGQFSLRGKMESVDDEFYGCCKRFYMFGIHSAKCLKVNGNEIKKKEQEKQEDGDPTTKKQSNL